MLVARIDLQRIDHRTDAGGRACRGDGLEAFPLAVDRAGQADGAVADLDRDVVADIGDVVDVETSLASYISPISTSISSVVQQLP